MRTNLRVALRTTIAVIFAAIPLTITSGTASADSIQTFRVDQSGFCLDDSNDFYARTFPCNGTTYQQWNVRVWGDGTRQLRNVNTGRCLGAAIIGGEPTLISDACSSSAELSWYVVPPASGGGIKFLPQVRDTWCLSESTESYAGGRYIDLHPCGGPIVYPDSVWR